MKHLIVYLSALSVVFGCNVDKAHNKEEETVTVADVRVLSDSTLREQLELLAVEDQTLRMLLPEVTEKYGRESKEMSYIWSLIHRQDSICISKLVHIVDSHGWLGKSRVGDSANQAIWIIIQHADLGLQEKYLPLLKESVEKGESEGWHLAFLEDRILMYKEQKQKYGTQAIWDNDLNKTKIYPIDDVENVNDRRRELGLETIEEYAASGGHVFDLK